MKTLRIYFGRFFSSGFTRIRFHVLPWLMDCAIGWTAEPLAALSSECPALSVPIGIPSASVPAAACASMSSGAKAADAAGIVTPTPAALSAAMRRLAFFGFFTAHIANFCGATRFAVAEMGLVTGAETFSAIPIPFASFPKPIAFAPALTSPKPGMSIVASCVQFSVACACMMPLVLSTNAAQPFCCSCSGVSPSAASFTSTPFA